MKSILTALICSVSIIYSMNAQVTIGSHLKPRSGALLDLRQREAANSSDANSSKGLLLPRVELSEISELKPMYSYADAENTPSENNLLEHTGLTVYNINTTEKDPSICPSGIISGIYTWDGRQWVPLNNNGGIFPNRSKDVSALVDNRDPNNPETYRIARFGKVGWWMIENLRADKMPDGTPIERKVTSNDYGDYTPFYNYPIKATSTIKDTNPSKDLVERHPEYGYMYSWKAATNGKSLDTDDSSQYEGVQGVCPDGWHLPSRLEWFELMDEIEKNICLYSTDPLLELPDYLKSRAAILINKTTGVEGAENLANGSSRSYEEGGFNFLPIGICSSAGYYQYGNFARAWTSSSNGYVNNHYQAWMVAVNVSNLASYPDHGQITAWSANAMLPVRCKKN